MDWRASPRPPNVKLDELGRRVAARPPAGVPAKVDGRAAVKPPLVKPAEVGRRAAARPPAAEPAEVDGRAAARPRTAQPDADLVNCAEEIFCGTNVYGRNCGDHADDVAKGKKTKRLKKQVSCLLAPYGEHLKDQDRFKAAAAAFGDL